MYLTYLIIGATILVSVLAFDRRELMDKMLFNPYAVIHDKKWYRLFSHGFIHADFIHLFFNMYVLYTFGVQGQVQEGYISQFYSVEPELINDFGVKGYFYFFLLYAGGLLFSSVYSLYKHQDNPMYNALGASGAVSAVVFAFIVLNPTSRLGIIFLPESLMLPAYIFGPLLILSEYYLAKRGGTNIGHDAHISGAIFGLVFVGLVDYNYYIDFFNAIFG